MSLKIAIASGKGGTGKTTVSINLLKAIVQNTNKTVTLVDCDVEEPNVHLFIGKHELLKKEEINQLIPQINEEKCIFCKKCDEYCEFNAITILPSRKFASVDESLCHSCGACAYVCPSGAITEVPHKIGEVSHYKSELGSTITSGKLKVGSSMQTMLIGETKKRYEESCDIALFDAPPGTSCSVVETITNVDFVILVTEPTPFGLHDMKLMIELLQKLHKPFGVVLNKSDIGFEKTLQFIEQNNINLLGKIPFDKEFASSYATGNILNYQSKISSKIYNSIINNIFEKLKE